MPEITRGAPRSEKNRGFEQFFFPPSFKKQFGWGAPRAEKKKKKTGEPNREPGAVAFKWGAGDSGGGPIPSGTPLLPCGPGGSGRPIYFPPPKKNPVPGGIWGPKKKKKNNPNPQCPRGALLGGLKRRGFSKGCKNLAAPGFPGAEKKNPRGGLGGKKKKEKKLFSNFFRGWPNYSTKKPRMPPGGRWCPGGTAGDKNKKRRKSYDFKTGGGLAQGVDGFFFPPGPPPAGGGDTGGGDPPRNVGDLQLTGGENGGGGETKNKLGRLL